MTVTDDVVKRMNELAGEEDNNLEIEYHANYFNTSENDDENNTTETAEDAEVVEPTEEAIDDTSFSCTG